MLDPNLPCPCGSEKPLQECCQPILDDHAKANTPEMLMRSRYTAFGLMATPHILKTWHSSTRPNTLSFETNPVKWVNLKIHPQKNLPENKNQGIVTFTAQYIENNTLCQLHESSKFVKEEGLWFYLDGKTEITKKNLSRNSSCPCGSGKKFKRCCIQ